MNRFPDFTLLAVDDVENNLTTLRALLSRHFDITIIEASSGQQALEIAYSNQSIDLILLDIQMPDLDGFETASMLKVHQRSRDIPIIFLTAAFKSEEFQRKGYELGAADYLLKPIDDDQLTNKISTYFRLIEKERNLNTELETQVAQRTAELNQTKHHLENIIQYMGEALLVLNPAGQIMSVNPAALDMLDYKEPELVGLAIGDVFEEEESAQATAFMGTWLEALVRAGAMQQIEARFIAQDGRRVPVLMSRSAIKDNNDELTHILCIAKDMTGYQRENEA